MSKALARAHVSTIMPAIMPALAPPESLPERISYYHRLSQEAGKISIMAALAAGVELLRAKAEVEHGMFMSWIKNYCPDITQRTANNYMRLAEGVLAEGELPALLEMPEQVRQETLAVTAESIDAKSLTQLYLDLGIVRPSPVSMGGARPGAGRPRKDADAQPVSMVADPDVHAAECLGYLGRLYAWAIDRDGWGYLSDIDLVTARATLQDIAKRADTIITNRRRNAGTK
jgi:hypothetical protein